MNAVTQRKTEIELAEGAVQLGACLNDCERAIRDAQAARRELIRILSLLGGQPGPDFVEAA